MLVPGMEMRRLHRRISMPGKLIPSGAGGGTFLVRHWNDLRNLWIIAVGVLLVLFVLPPRHEYPIIDDWIYARSVQDQVATGAFHAPDRSQANLLGLTLWGTLWVRLFGFSFSILTASTLVLAFGCLVAFYCLARAVDVPPSGALLGTALVGFNPLFIHLSYSFMTDVPFLSLEIFACLCFVLGLKGHGRWWLLIGGLAAGYSYLIRQFGVIPPACFMAYLALDGLVTRKWRRREMLEIAAIPILFVAGWYLFSKGFPENSATQEANRVASEFVGTPDWPQVFFNRAMTVIPLTAFFAWTALRLNRRRLILAVMWSVIIVWATIAVGIPHRIQTFTALGNILRTGGIDFFEYKQAQLWTTEVWYGLALFIALLGGLMLGAMTDSFIDWLAGLRRRRLQEPVVGVYLVGVALFAVSAGFLGYIFDRYVLIFFPAAVLYMIRDARRWSKGGWAFSLAALALIAGFSLLAQADFIDHDNARWQAGSWLNARAPLPIHVGYDWDGWVGIPPSGLYEVTDIENPGWITEQRFPYVSRLSGFQTRYVLAQSAPGAPPLGK